LSQPGTLRKSAVGLGSRSLQMTSRRIATAMCVLPAPGSPRRRRPWRRSVPARNSFVHCLQTASALRVSGTGSKFSHSRPALVGPALLVDDLFGGPAQRAVALGRERLAEEDDLLGLELALAAETAGHEAATAVGGWRTWHSG
jgi:hypothetical protein